MARLTPRYRDQPWPRTTEPGRRAGLGCAMSNTIAVVIAVIGILALFVAAGALFAVLRKAGNQTIPGSQETAMDRGSVSPELAAEAERRAAEADRAAERRLEAAGRAADQIRGSA